MYQYHMYHLEIGAKASPGVKTLDGDWARVQYDSARDNGDELYSHLCMGGTKIICKVIMQVVHCMASLGGCERSIPTCRTQKSSH